MHFDDLKDLDDFLTCFFRYLAVIFDVSHIRVGEFFTDFFLIKWDVGELVEDANELTFTRSSLMFVRVVSP